MDNFWQSLKSLKVPSLTLLGLFFWFGAKLLLDGQNQSLQQHTGFTLIIIASVWGVIFLVDYRYREDTDHVVQKQKEAIDNQAKIISSFRQTNILSDKLHRGTMAETNGFDRSHTTYRTKDGNDTETS